MSKVTDQRPKSKMSSGRERNPGMKPKTARVETTDSFFALVGLRTSKISCRAHQTLLAWCRVDTQRRKAHAPSRD